VEDDKKFNRVGLKLEQKELKKEIEKQVDKILELLGIEKNSNTEQTPDRVARAYLEMTQGYKQEQEIKDDCKFFDTISTGYTTLKGIPFAILCSHHLMPFSGTISISFKAKDGKVLGLSKFKRIIDVFSKRLQLQETLAKQIVDFLWDLGCFSHIMLTLTAKHTCIGCRGVNTPDVEAITIEERKCD
jgi:GTP cyclohydrolase I